MELFYKSFYGMSDIPLRKSFRRLLLIIDRRLVDINMMVTDNLIKIL